MIFSSFESLFINQSITYREFVNMNNYLVRTRVPYNQYHFRYKVPKDLREFFQHKEFRVSLKSTSLPHCEIISTKLQKTTQSIFKQVRQGKMNEITLQDVKEVLRNKVKQTIKHIHHYENDTNKYDEEELNERIFQSSEKEKILKERLKSNYNGTVEKIEKEIDRILNSRDLKTDKNNVDYKGLVRKWTDLKIIRESWKKELLEGQGRYEEEYLKELEDNWKIGLLDKETTRTPLIQSPVVRTPKYILTAPVMVQLIFMAQ